MRTNTPEERTLLAELARDVVSEIAPEELDLFDEMVEEYFEDPTPIDLDTTVSDDALGFGLETMLAAATPAAMAVASVVLGFVIDEVVDTTAERSITPMLRRIFNKAAPDAAGGAVPRFTAEQLAKLKAEAIKQARAFGMDGTEAEQMASLMVGSLVTPT